MTVTTYFSVVLPNKTGEGAKMLSALKEAGINFTAMWGYPIKGKKAQVDLLPDDPKAFQKAAKKLGLEAEKKGAAILFNGVDQPGVVAEALAKLAAAGIAVVAAMAVCAGEGRFGSLIQIAADDAKKAAKALK